MHDFLKSQQISKYFTVLARFKKRRAGRENEGMKGREEHERKGE